MRHFTAFLDARRSEDGRGPQFYCVDMYPGLGLAFKEDLRHFTTWLEGGTSTTAGATAVPFTTQHLLVDDKNLCENDDRWQVFAHHGRAMIIRLLSLARISTLTLRLRCRFKVPPPPLCSHPLLDTLPTTCRTLTTLSLHLDTLDAMAAQALEEVLTHLRGLDALELRQEQPTDSDGNSAAATILRVAMDGKVSQIRRLKVRDFDLTTIDSENWDFLSANHTLKELVLYCDLGRRTLKHLASALKSNTGLQQLTVLDRTSEGGIAAFAEVLAVNTCLEELRFPEGQEIMDLDVLAATEGLRQNRTLKVLELPSLGLTPAGLQTVIEVVRYHNTALENVFLSWKFAMETFLVYRALDFHRALRAACQAHRVGVGASTKGHDSNANESVMRRFWPVLGWNHPTAKATVLFCEARVRAEIVAQSMRTMPTRKARKRPPSG